MRRLLALALATAALAACPHPPPASLPRPQAPPAPHLRVPAGCEGDLSGLYAHALSGRYRYRGRDDGGSLSLDLERFEADGGEVSIVVVRTLQGFVGKAFGTGFTSTGHGCPVSFATEVIACGDAGIRLRSAATATINDECQAPQSGAGPAMVEHELLRLGSPGDAGAADAGQSSVPGGGGDGGGGPDGGGGANPRDGGDGGTSPSR